MKKQLRWILPLCIAGLLLGSFPAREFLGTLACDLMRIGGFLLLLVYIVGRLKKQRA